LQVKGSIRTSGQLKGSGGGMWVYGRNSATVRNTSYGQTTGQSFNPVASIKTTLGSWEIGNLSGEEGLTLSYVTDDDYNTDNNKSKKIYFPASEGNVRVEKTLYSNTSGTNGTVTLNESAANFSYLTIYFKWRDRHASVKVFSPNGKGVTLLNAITWTTGETTQYENQTCTISGTSITRGARTYFNATSTEFYAGANDNNYFYITGVVGHR
jgi:hypothetical protein